MTAGRKLSPEMLVLFALLPVAWSCHTVELTPEARLAVRVVDIAPEVTLPDDLELGEPALSGPLGFVASEWIDETRTQQVNRTMEAGQVSLQQIVRSEFEAALAGSGLFQLGTPAERQATFHLEVNRVGIAYAMNLSYQRKPVLLVQASLRDPSGTVLWQRREIADQRDDGTPEQSIMRYLDEPEFVREAFTAAARVATAKLVENLREQMQ